MPIHVGIDLETTSLDTASCFVTELGAATEDQELATLVRTPGVFVSQTVCKLTGISTKMLQDAPLIQDVLKHLNNFLLQFPETVLVSFNGASYDLLILFRLLIDQGWSVQRWLQMHRIVGHCDMKVYSKHNWCMERYDLGSLIKAVFGDGSLETKEDCIDVDDFDPLNHETEEPENEGPKEIKETNSFEGAHSALIDSQATLNLFSVVADKFRPACEHEIILNAQIKMMGNSIRPLSKKDFYNLSDDALEYDKGHREIVVRGKPMRIPNAVCLIPMQQIP